MCFFTGGEEMTKKEIDAVLMALNLSQMFCKYPFGNKELTAKVKALEDQGKVVYDEKWNKWREKK